MIIIKIIACMLIIAAVGVVLVELFNYIKRAF